VSLFDDLAAMTRSKTYSERRSLHSQLQQYAGRRQFVFHNLKSSQVNTLVLILSDGRELAWVNLTACVADVRRRPTSLTSLLQN
jgi:hypothetical protein